MIIGGTAVATIAQFMPNPNATALTAAQQLGIGAALFALFGGIWALTSEIGTEGELALAARGVEEATRAKERAASLRSALIRMNSWDQVGRTVSDTVNGMLSGFGEDEVLATSMLKSAARDLAIAAGLSDPDIWSIAIYKIRLDSAGAREACPVHAERSLKGQLGNARSWVENDGLPGVCLARGRALSIADMHAPEHDGMYEPKHDCRTSDSTRYRSALAVPLMVETGVTWGLLVATSDAVGHFGTDAQHPIPKDRPIRDFAALVTLALRLRARLGTTDDDLAKVGA